MGDDTKYRLITAWQKRILPETDEMGCKALSSQERDEISDDEGSDEEEQILSFSTYQTKQQSEEASMTSLFNTFKDNSGLLTGKAHIQLMKTHEKIIFSCSAKLVNIQGSGFKKKEKNETNCYLCVTTEALYVLTKIIRLKKFKRYRNLQPPRYINCATSATSSRIADDVCIHFPKSSGGDLYVRTQLKQEFLSAVTAVFRALVGGNLNLSLKVVPTRSLVNAFSKGREEAHSDMYQKRLMMMKRQKQIVNDFNEKLSVSVFSPHYVLGVGCFGKTVLVTKIFGNQLRDHPGRFVLKDFRVNDDRETRNAISPDLVLDEIACLRALDHPFLSKFRGDFSMQSPRRYYMLFDFYSGGSLKHHIYDQDTLREPRIAKSCLAQIIACMHYLHSNRITLKAMNPEFILLCPTGCIRFQKIGYRFDLDLHGERSDFSYLAPELISHKKWNVRGKIGRFRDGFVPVECDYWSLGVLVYEMFCFTHPFRGDVDQGSQNNAKILRERILKVVYPPLPTRVDPFISMLIESLLSSSPSARAILFTDSDTRQPNSLSEISKQNFWKKDGSNDHLYFLPGLTESYAQKLSSFTVPLNETDGIKEYFPEAMTYDDYCADNTENLKFESHMNDHEVRTVGLTLKKDASPLSQRNSSMSSNPSLCETTSIILSEESNAWVEGGQEQSLNSVEEQECGMSDSTDFVDSSTSDDDDDGVAVKRTDETLSSSALRFAQSVQITQKLHRVLHTTKTQRLVNDIDSKTDRVK